MSIDPNLNFAVLPNSTRGTAVAERLNQRGFEILCHLPMQPENASVSPAIPGGLPNEAASLRPARAPLHFDLRLIGSLQPGAQHLKKILADYAEGHAGARPDRVLMLIGPEGDFTPAEIALARSHGCAPLTLGPIILRVETAAIYCLSILSYELLGER